MTFMLTLLKNKLSALSLVGVLVVLAFVPFVPIQTAQAITGATSPASLSQKLSAELGADNTGPKVLGQSTKVPLFPRGYIYPIPELGNCDSKGACYDYCQASVNLEQCALVSFRNGFMTSAQLQKTLTFNSYLKAGYFASCSSLSTCATLCDLEASQSECAVLALNLDKGSRVLGATDQNLTASTNDSVLAHCTSLDQCSSGSSVGATSILSSLIYSGQAPKNCVNAEQCQAYCIQTQSSECTALFQKVAQLSGVTSGFSTMNKVFTVNDPGQPTNNNQLFSSLVIAPGDPGYDPGAVGGGGSVPSPTYQPSSYLGCVSNSQTATNPNGDVTPQQIDNLSSSINQCDQQYSPSTSQIDNFSNSGNQKVAGAVSSISDCILSKSTSADIASCFSY